MTRVRMLKAAAAIVGVLIGAAGTARADAIHIVGSTDACFNCTSSGPFSATTTLAGLTFSGVSFDVTTDSSGSATISNLGGFTLDRSVEHNYANDTFLLRVLFSIPAGVNGGGGTYGALLSGNINQANNGTVTIDFDNTFQWFLFAGGGRKGSFEFGVINDPQLKIRNSQPTIIGAIRNATETSAPEPASLLLLGSGLTLVSRRLRRRT